jgi:Ca-activated chloride channel family protein
MKATRTALLLTLLGLLLVPQALADGLVIVRPHPEYPDPTQLAVRYHDVDIVIRDQVARVEIDQVFRNLNPYDVEGEYIFPIPDGAAVSDFVLYVDGMPVHAQAMDAAEALKVYRELVRENKDPALLEYAGREMFRARIAPFPAHGDRRVKLAYDHLVEREGGLYRFIYPLSTEKFSSRPLERALVSIVLETDRPIRNAYCPSHDVSIEHIGPKHVRVVWEESGTRPDRDMVLYYSLAEGPMDIRLVPFRPDRGEDGYFMLLASMGYDNEISVAPKDVVFVIDHSGSMRGEKIEQAREALVYSLRHLNRDDRFNIVAFSTAVDAYAHRLCDASSRRVKDAVRFVERLGAGGSTNISGALERALETRFDAERPTFVVFLTDGLPTVGETDPERIIAQVRRRMPRKWDDDSWWSDDRERMQVRVFPFGVGYDVNAVLLDQLAIENGGSPSYVRPGEDLRARLEGFYDQVAHPVMTDIRIRIKGAKLLDLEPRQVPDMFRGSQLVLFGRYRGDGKVKVELTGLIEGRRQTFRAKAKLPRYEDTNAFVGRLWATRRVGSLLRHVRLYGEERELVDEIKDLGLEFGVVTPYTSFLVDESDRFHPMEDVLADRERDRRDGPSWGGVTRMYRGGEPKKEGLKGHFAPPAASLQADVQLFGDVGMSSSGKAAVDMSSRMQEMVAAETEEAMDAAAGVRVVSGHTFHRDGDMWKDADCPDNAKVIEIEVGSDAYFDLLAAHPEIGPVLALGEQVIFEAGGQWYQTVPAA